MNEQQQKEYLERIKELAKDAERKLSKLNEEIKIERTKSLIQFNKIKKELY